MNDEPTKEQDPSEEETVSSEQKPAGPQDDPFGDGKRVLIVEDDPATIELVRKLLTDRLFEVFQAADGKQAWDKIRPETKPDLIICDFLMPEMNGFELFKGLRDDEKTKDIPIIFLSARKNIEDSVLASGADAFFSKPLETTKFLEEVKKIILRGPLKTSASAENTPKDDSEKK